MSDFSYMPPQFGDCRGFVHILLKILYITMQTQRIKILYITMQTQRIKILYITMQTQRIKILYITM